VSGGSASSYFRAALHTCSMTRARRHQRLAAAFAFGLLALVAELAGRSLTHRLDVGRHVHPGAYAHADYYPVLLIVIKAGAALLLAQLAWRLVRAHRVLSAAGLRAPWPRLELSARLWLGAFGLTSLCYLLQTDAERISTGRWPLLAPWLHTSALPVFAVLAVLVAVLYRLVIYWLHELERTAAEVTALAPRAAAPDAAPRRRSAASATPRRLFGIAFESRPPPLTA
jgi:hypothetical protein